MAGSAFRLECGVICRGSVKAVVDESRRVVAVAASNVMRASVMASLLVLPPRLVDRQRPGLDDPPTPA
jgi:hypothetical protein